MRVRELAIGGVFVFEPPKFDDNRGLFTAPFQGDAFARAVGHPMRLGQTNHSVSRRGTIRGVHYADTPPGQAKYVYCPRGALLDVLVDVRVGSPTFGRWDSVRLDERNLNAVYVPEGVGHALFAFEDNTVASYLCSTGYNPSAERGVTPLDDALGLPWPTDVEHVLSERDAKAPTLAEAEAAGLLPSYEACLAHYESLRSSPS